MLFFKHHLKLGGRHLASDRAWLSQRRQEKLALAELFRRGSPVRADDEPASYADVSGEGVKPDRRRTTHLHDLTYSAGIGETVSPGQRL